MACCPVCENDVEKCECEKGKPDKNEIQKTISKELLDDIQYHVNNNLCVIHGYTDLLLLQETGHTDWVEKITKIQKCVRSTSQYIKNLERYLGGQHDKKRSQDFAIN